MSSPAFGELLRRLVAADVRFVLVGGFAVNAWGVLRGTKDLDIVVDLEPELRGGTGAHACNASDSYRTPGSDQEPGRQTYGPSPTAARRYTKPSPCKERRQRNATCRAARCRSGTCANLESYMRRSGAGRFWGCATAPFLVVDGYDFDTRRRWATPRPRPARVPRPPGGRAAMSSSARPHGRACGER